MMSEDKAISIHLNGDNYYYWSSVVKNFIVGKELLRKVLLEVLCILSPTLQRSMNLRCLFSMLRSIINLFRNFIMR